MNIKLIASDMDDTLLNSAGEISPRTVSALQSAMARGIKVVLASGRMIESMLPAAHQLSSNAPIIAYNGSVTYDWRENRVINERPIQVSTAIRIAKAAEALNLHIQCYQDGDYFFERHNEYSRDYAAGIAQDGIATGTKLSEFIQRGQYKMLIIAPPARIAEVRPQLEREFEGELSLITSKPDYLECIAPKVNKGEALMELAATMGITPSEVMAFGDGQNDLEMLTWAKYGHAMANASEYVRTRVKHTAPSNDDDGVARVIEQYLS